MDTFTATLKRQWFAEIVDGEKRVEYREIKPYWAQRLRAVRVPFRLVLRNGMNPSILVLTVRIDRVSLDPWGKGRSGVYSLHIGRVLKIERGIERRECPSRCVAQCRGRPISFLDWRPSDPLTAVSSRPDSRLRSGCWSAG